MKSQKSKKGFHSEDGSWIQALLSPYSEHNGESSHTLVSGHLLIPNPFLVLLLSPDDILLLINSTYIGLTSTLTRHDHEHTLRF